MKDKEKQIEELINNFIKKWMPNSSTHLLDSDENDGEILRNKLKKICRCAEGATLAEQETQKKVRDVIISFFTKNFPVKTSTKTFTSEELQELGVDTEVMNTLTHYKIINEKSMNELLKELGL